MSKKAITHPKPIPWKFEPHIPTNDFFEEHAPSDLDHLSEAVDNFIYLMESGDFHCWEAVVSEEQGLRLTKLQKKVLGEIVSFGDDFDDEVLYINETARPSERWYEIVAKIAPHLLAEPFLPAVHLDEFYHDGWPRLECCIEEHAKGLSLPKNVSSPLEIIPTDLRHKLWLQSCSSALDELGQETPKSEAEEDGQDCVDWFIDRLRNCRASVDYLGITIASLRGFVGLPAAGQELLTRAMKEKLGIDSEDEPITDRL